ncbi:unnamed protein product [Cunninghamella blakesleeana]
MNKLFILVIGVLVLIQTSLVTAMSQKDINNILKIHNKYRSKHRAPALKWDKAIASFAQSHSRKCVFQHSGKKGYGENIAMGYRSWNDVINAWYNEEKDYDYNNPVFGSGTGHFTQVVWKGTKKIGCGVTSCNGSKYYSCNYKAPGNYYGEFEKNVLPPKK